MILERMNFNGKLNLIEYLKHKFKKQIRIVKIQIIISALVGLILLLISLSYNQKIRKLLI